MGYKSRDVEVSFLPGDLCIVVACDSCGAIGSKELDAVQVPASVTGRCTARVALLEVIASGARPEIMTVAISAEPEPTGADIIGGIRAELAAAGLEHVKLIVSTEKNIPTRQTGLGVSVVGCCQIAGLRLGRTQIGDWVYGLGKPKVGSEAADPDDPEIVRTEHLRKLLENAVVHDLIPVGSGGIRCECELAAGEIQGRVDYEANCPVPLDKSAGPSTVLIITASHPFQEFAAGPLPFYRIGRVLEKR